MNEQLVVKNFGPIKDATVDFKRVTVFIGPTGGGKSTLAKLLSVFKSQELFPGQKKAEIKSLFKDYSIDNYFAKGSSLLFVDKDKNIDTITSRLLVKRTNSPLAIERLNSFRAKRDLLAKETKSMDDTIRNIQHLDHAAFQKAIYQIWMNMQGPLVYYIPAERIFISALEYSWAGLIRDDIGLSKQVLNFANTFSLARKEVPELGISFLNVKYIHRNGQDFIKIYESETLFRLYETASGIQSVTPLLVLLEHLSCNTEQAQSFIIEEPELNLYPTAQQGLLNWLVEKCTKGENDLTITTHSPYILSHLNLMLYAYQVAEKHPDQKAAIAAIVPEASWINPKEFACYQVEGGGVHSLVDAELGLIDNNALDNISGDKADAFDQLININRGFAHA